jgi:glucose/mannose-6-phosphate isomerase
VTTMSDLIGTLPEQLRWAASLDVPRMPPASSAIVAGMGGSGIAGDVAAVVAAAEGRRVDVHKSYGLPGWADASSGLVVAVSHSGNTEETLSAFDAALAASLPAAAVSVGGRLADAADDAGAGYAAIPASPQPRAAFGHLAGAALRVLEAAGVLGPQAAALEEAADVVEGLLAGEAGDRAARIAEGLAGRVAVVYGGAGVGAVAANRWKTQINENGKAPAYWSVLPELDHNEVVGWSAHPDLGMSSVGVVFLEDSGDHPRVRLRSALTRELIRDLVGVAGVVASQGDGVLARIMSLAVIGDLVSVRLAELAGVDPVPVDIIEDLKQRLADNG